jgi:hypothetical protein
VPIPGFLLAEGASRRRAFLGEPCFQPLKCSIYNRQHVCTRYTLNPLSTGTEAFLAMLNWAERDGSSNGGSLFGRKPLRGLEIPKEQSPRRPMLSEAQFTNHKHNSRRVLRVCGIFSRDRRLIFFSFAAATYCLTNIKCMFSTTSGLTSVSVLAVFETTFQVLVNIANGDEAPRPNTIDSVDVLP